MLVCVAKVYLKKINPSQISEIQDVNVVVSSLRSCKLTNENNCYIYTIGLIRQFFFKIKLTKKKQLLHIY